ncbi:MAG: ComF family protein, partial [Sediminibacterium sp.]|nr:ComF family protein [Sediminibacterium sp.]
MRKNISNCLRSFLHLLYPHYCEGCHTDLSSREILLCASCENSLPQTHFWNIPNNAVEKIFRHRLSIEAAAAAYFFTNDSLMQHLIMQLKYHNMPEAGIWLGNRLGKFLLSTERFNSVDSILPLPLHPKKEFIRGYNQALKIAQGVAEALHKPVITNALIRNQFTKTQTRENRVNRWNNMQGVFAIPEPNLIRGKHCLLVDDVITTGATLEACGNLILSIEGCKLSVATAAYTAI